MTNKDDTFDVFILKMEIVRIARNLRYIIIDDIDNMAVEELRRLKYQLEEEEKKQEYIKQQNHIKDFER